MQMSSLNVLSAKAKWISNLIIIPSSSIALCGLQSKIKLTSIQPEVH